MEKAAKPQRTAPAKKWGGSNAMEPGKVSPIVNIALGASRKAKLERLSKTLDLPMSELIRRAVDSMFPESHA